MACTCCILENRAELDAAIVAGESVRSIGRRFGVSPWAVSRHHTRHLSPALAGVRTATGAEDREPFPERLERLYVLAEAMFAEAVSAGHGAQALNLLKEMRGQLETIGRATGEYNDQPQTVINFMADPGVQWALSVMYAELAAHPEIRERIAERLQIEAPR